MFFKLLKEKSVSFFKCYRLPLLAGLLLGTSYIPFPPLGLFFGWIPLWHFIFQQKSLKQVIIGAWVCQFLGTLIGFNWVAYTIHHFGEMPWIVSFLGLLVYCSFANIFMCVAGGLWFVIVKKRPQSPIVFQLLLFPVLYSLSHSLVPTIFPWNMGYSWFYAGLPAFQTAELWGFRFLNTLTYVFNLLFWIVFQHKWDKTGRRAVFAVAGLFVILNISGFYLKRRLPQADSFSRVLLVQHNVGQLKNLKVKERFKGPQEQVYFYLKELTYKGLIKNYQDDKTPEDIHFVLWPEGAYPYLVSKAAGRIKSVSSLAEKLNTPLITGGVSKDGSGYSNSVFVLSRKGRLLKPIYDKSILLAFGEYLPGVFSLPLVRKFLPYFQGYFQPGSGPKTVYLEGVSLGFQICYESLFDFHARDLVNQGASILLNVTNDSWYGAWQEPRQHLYMSLARAVEVRRPLIRGTNTGFSGGVRSDGSLMEISPFNRQWVHLYDVPYRKNPPRTLFLSWGFYINEIFLFLLSLFGLVSFGFGSRKKKVS